MAYRGVYSGIDLVYHGGRGQLEYDFDVAAGADPKAIGLSFGGVGSMAGLFLMDDLVLRHDPDLCLVEFLTADMIGYTPDALITDAVHGIAEKLLSAGCTPVATSWSAGPPARSRSPPLPQCTSDSSC